MDDAWATPEISMAEPARVETPTDPFAAFAPIPKPAVVREFLLEVVLQTPIEAAPVAPPDPEVEPEPDPEVLATLARLERFLGTIQSLRA
jgi:hypothetical protein